MLKTNPLRRVPSRWLAAFLVMAPAAFSQQYTNVGGVAVPNLGSATEAVKFGDWDLDGDLDMIYANGGDAGAQLSKLLENQGGAQGGALGTFVDKSGPKLVARRSAGRHR
jgi:hypothetical protein